MSSLPSPWNPVTYAQFHVGGGWRTAGAVVGGFTLLVGGAIWLSAGTDRRPAEAFEAWAHGLVLIQAMVLFVYGTYRVNAAVRGDVAGHMIESHRLMPMSPLSAVLGYVLGTPVVPLALFAVGFALGGVCVAGSEGRVGMEEWAVANAMVLTAAVCAWAVVAQFALAARGGFIILLVAGAVALASQGELLLDIPALNVMTGPLLGRSVVMLHHATGNSPAFEAAVGMQAAVSLICGRVAVRRYRSPAAAGFSPLLGLLLTGTWVAASLAALTYHDLFAGLLAWRRPGVSAEYTASVAGGLLVAAIAVSAAARRMGELGPAPGRLWAVLWTVPAAAALVTTVALAPASEGTFSSFSGGRPTFTYRPVGVSLGLPVVAGSTLAWLAGMAGVFVWLAARRRRAWAIVTLWIGFTWIGPIVADQIWRSVTRQNSPDASPLTALSPVGAVAMTYDGNTSGVLIGLTGQVVIAAFPIVAAVRACRRDAAAERSRLAAV